MILLSIRFEYHKRISIKSIKQQCRNGTFIKVHIIKISIDIPMSKIDICISYQTALLIAPMVGERYPQLMHRKYAAIVALFNLSL